MATSQEPPDKETAPVAEGRNQRNGRFAGKPGPGRKKGSRPKAKLDFIGRWKPYFLSDRYQKNLMLRIERGKASGEAIYIQQMCFGKPTEKLTISNPDGTALQLVQVYLPQKQTLPAYTAPAEAVDGEAVEVQPVGVSSQAAATTNGHAPASPTPVKILLPENGTGTNGHKPNGSDNNGSHGG